MGLLAKLSSSDALEERGKGIILAINNRLQ